MTIVIQASLRPCALRAESQWEGNVHGHRFPEDRLAARAINYNRQGDRRTDGRTDSTAEGADRPRQLEQARQIQRDEEGVGRGGGGEEQHARPRGDGKKNQSSRCGASAPTPGQCVTAIRPKKQASVIRDKAMRDGDK